MLSNVVARLRCLLVVWPALRSDVELSALPEQRVAPISGKATGLDMVFYPNFASRVCDFLLTLNLRGWLELA